MLKNWFRPDVVELEKRVSVLERAVVQLCGIIETHVRRIDENTQMLDDNMHNLAQVIADTVRPFPGQSNN